MFLVKQGLKMEMCFVKGKEKYAALKRLRHTKVIALAGYITLHGKQGQAKVTLSFLSVNVGVSV